MQFACVEYTTKTGAIWRHRPERPNYLCDPEKEIDPTSFGCYTSTLAGEHIPLIGLIYGSLERPPTAIERARQGLMRKLTGTFSRYDLRSLKRFDVLLVIYQLSHDDELVRFIHRARAELPDTVLVSCSSPPFGRLRAHWKDHPETALRYRQFLDASHLNMNVCRATVPYYYFLSRTPSLYLPQPYPVEYALDQTKHAGAGDVPEGPTTRTDAEGPLHGAHGVSGASPVPGQIDRGIGADRRKWEDPVRQDPPLRPILYVAGDTVRPDIMTGHLIARVLQQRHPELLIRVTKTPEFLLNTAFLRGARYEVVPFRPWAEQLQELASTRLVINTDLWWTRGRVPVDCAAAGVPCVGTTSDGQTELWPDLAGSESLEIDHLLALAERALTDEEFRSRVVAKAQRRLTNYQYVRTAERFTRAVELARTDRLAEWHDPIWKDDVLVLPEAPA